MFIRHLLYESTKLSLVVVSPSMGREFAHWNQGSCCACRGGRSVASGSVLDDASDRCGGKRGQPSTLHCTRHTTWEFNPPSALPHLPRIQCRYNGANINLSRYIIFWITNRIGWITCLFYFHAYLLSHHDIFHENHEGIRCFGSYYIPFFLNVSYFYIDVMA